MAFNVPPKLPVNTTLKASNMRGVQPSIVETIDASKLPANAKPVVREFGTGRPGSGGTFAESGEYQLEVKPSGGRDAYGFEIPAIVALYDASGNFKEFTTEIASEAANDGFSNDATVIGKPKPIYILKDYYLPNPKIDASGNILNANQDNVLQKEYNSGSIFGNVKDLFKSLGPIVPIALSFALPGMGSAIASQLIASNVITNAAIANAVGTAMASTAIQMAQGVDFETALKNATVNAIVQTGAPSVATEINKVVKIPAVSDAITSAGASALKTAAAGGSAADIERNITAALVGSATASATGSNIAGSAAGGAVTGGAEGALVGAGTAYANKLENERIAKEKAAADEKAKATASVDYEKTVNDIITKELNQVMLAGGGASPAEMPGYARALENANKPLLRLVQEAANDPDYLNKLPDLEKSLFKAGTSIAKVLGLGFELLTYSPELNKAEMDYFNSQEFKDRMRDAEIQRLQKPLPQTEIQPGSRDVTTVNVPEPQVEPTPVPPPATSPAVSPGTAIVIPTPVITPRPSVQPSPEPQPEPETRPLPLPLPEPQPQPLPLPQPQPQPQPQPLPEPSVTPTTTPNPDAEILKLIQPAPAPSISPAPQPAVRPAPVPRPKPGTSSRLPSLVLPTDIPEPSGGGTPSRPPTAQPGTGEEPPIEEMPPVEEPVEEPVPTPDEEQELPPVEDKTGTPVDKPYNPRLFIYGGTRPSTLSKTLGTSIPTVGTTTGTSVGLGGRGEIESKESGKKRKTVWNEESLRLKDALGL